MCDSFVPVGSATADGSLVFGKNSDRPAAEEQRPIYCPARRYPAGACARCTYIEIPEAAETLAVLLPQPTWMWGRR
jgi:secernin